MSRSPFLEVLSHHVLAHHYGRRTVDSYVYWIRFFIRFHNKTHPQDMGATELLASMIHGSGLRRIEAVTLRVNNIDFDQGLVRVWGGKGNKHRIVTVAPELYSALRKQIAKVEQLLSEDLANSRYAGVWLPNALGRQYPYAHRSLGWHYLFPSTSLGFEPGTDNLRRHHVDESSKNHGNLHTRTEERRAWGA